MPLLSLEILVTVLPISNPFILAVKHHHYLEPYHSLHTKKYPPSLLCTKVLSADCYYGPVADITAVDCSHARLSQWAAGCLIHLCVLSAYQDQARGSHALESLN